MNHCIQINFSWKITMTWCRWWCLHSISMLHSRNPFNFPLLSSQQTVGKETLLQVEHIVHLSCCWIFFHSLPSFFKLCCNSYTLLYFGFNILSICKINAICLLSFVWVYFAFGYLLRAFSFPMYLKESI